MVLDSPLKIMIVDDHFIVRSGLVASLELESDLVVVAECESGEAACQSYPETSPDLILMDLQLPGWSGIQTTAQLIQIDAAARVLIFSTFARDDEVQAALDAGALGYLQKTAERSELITAIHRVAAGDRHLSASLEARLKSLQIGPNITLREREILALIARGQANKEIAAALGISEDTVKRHISNLFNKLGVKDRAQATAEAIRRGIIHLQSTFP